MEETPVLMRLRFNIMAKMAKLIAKGNNKAKRGKNKILFHIGRLAFNEGVPTSCVPDSEMKQASGSMGMGENKKRCFVCARKACIHQMA